MPTPATCDLPPIRFSKCRTSCLRRVLGPALRYGVAAFTSQPLPGSAPPPPPRPAWSFLPLTVADVMVWSPRQVALWLFSSQHCPSPTCHCDLWHFPSQFPFPGVFLPALPFVDSSSCRLHLSSSFCLGKSTDVTCGNICKQIPGPMIQGLVIWGVVKCPRSLAQSTEAGLPPFGSLGLSSLFTLGGLLRLSVSRSQLLALPTIHTSPAISAAGSFPW